MDYFIDNPTQHGKYTREEVQALIDEQRIGPNTKIWNSEWGTWKKLRETNFDLSKAKYEPASGLPDQLFLSIRPFLDSIDKGALFRKPFSWLYAVIAILNLVFPVYIMLVAINNNLLDMPSKGVVYFLTNWLVFCFVAWIGFQIWWDRKYKVTIVFQEGDEFAATPVFSHFIQTFGEWAGTWVGIVGFSSSLLTTLFLGNEYFYYNNLYLIGFNRFGVLDIILLPLLGYFIILFTRFLAEQSKALSSIANDTRKFSSKR